MTDIECPNCPGDVTELGDGLLEATCRRCGWTAYAGDLEGPDGNGGDGA